MKNPSNIMFKGFLTQQVMGIEDLTYREMPENKGKEKAHRPIVPKSYHFFVKHLILLGIGESEQTTNVSLLLLDIFTM